jgi:hypothetical protein
MESVMSIAKKLAALRALPQTDGVATMIAELEAEQTRKREYNTAYIRARRANWTDDDRKKNSERTARWMQDNVERVKTWRRTRYEERKQHAIEYKGGACQHCNAIVSLAAFDFHHINDKEKEIAWLLRCASWERIVKELDKCLLLCSNCHRTHHNR